MGTQSLFADGEGLGQIKAKKEVISPSVATLGMCQPAMSVAGTFDDYCLVCARISCLSQPSLVRPLFLPPPPPPPSPPPPPPFFSLLNCREVLSCASSQLSVLLWRVWRKYHFNSPRRASSAWDEPSTTPRSLSTHYVSTNRS